MGLILGLPWPPRGLPLTLAITPLKLILELSWPHAGLPSPIRTTPFQLILWPSWAHLSLPAPRFPTPPLAILGPCVCHHRAFRNTCPSHRALIFGLLASLPLRHKHKEGTRACQNAAASQSDAPFRHLRVIFVPTATHVQASLVSSGVS